MRATALISPTESRSGRGEVHLANRETHAHVILAGVRAARVTLHTRLPCGGSVSVDPAIRAKALSASPLGPGMLETRAGAGRGWRGTRVGRVFKQDSPRVLRTLVNNVFLKGARSGTSQTWGATTQKEQPGKTGASLGEVPVKL